MPAVRQSQTAISARLTGCSTGYDQATSGPRTVILAYSLRRMVTVRGTASSNRTPEPSLQAGPTNGRQPEKKRAEEKADQNHEEDRVPDCSEACQVCLQYFLHCRVGIGVLRSPCAVNGPDVD